MATQLSALTDVALEVRDCLGAGEGAAAFRIVADWYARARVGPLAEVERSVQAVPQTTGEAPWDGILAGLTEQVCLERDLACPEWTFAPDRYLPTWWFLTPHRSLHPSAFVEAPIALANRGIFIHRGDFDGV